MPVWQRETKQFVADEKVVVLGVIQEQHAERCRLYAQWKNFTFPIVQDAMTSNGLAVVPVVLFIDEHGIIQNRRPKPNQLKEFVATKFPKPEKLAVQVPASRTEVTALKKTAQISKLARR